MTTTANRLHRFLGAVLLITLGRVAIAQAPAAPEPVPAPVAPDAARAITRRPVPPARRLPTAGALPAAVPAPAAAVRSAPPSTATGGAEPTTLKFESSPADIVLQTYAEVTKRTLLMAPDVPKPTITLRSQSELSRDEFLQAIETVLVMNGIALQPVGDKFLKVLPAKDLRKLGAKTELIEPEAGQYPEDGKMVSQMISLKHIALEEAKKVIEGFKRGDGQIQLFERTNSILITDTVDNVNRMMEILRYVDQPLINREETNIRHINFAKAADIKKVLEEIIADSIKAQQQAKSVPEANVAGAPGITRRNLPAPVPGVIRPTAPAAQTPAENAILETLVADAERGVIRGKVQITAYERTNLLIIITRPENMAFFDKIISVLDVETEPDVMWEVFRLEYASVVDKDGAKGVATLLNDLIGNPKKDDGNAAPAGAAGAAGEAAKSETLAEAAARRVQAAANAGKPAEPGMSKVGELNKDNIKILPDERTNGLIIMASKSDLATLRAIIKDMDIMLSQVLVETVIVEVTLNDSLTTGIDWVQRSLLGYGNDRKPVVGFAGQGGGGGAVPAGGLGYTEAGSFGTKAIGGLAYYLTFFDLNVDMVLQAVATDSRSRTLASPAILTQDNKEASIEATTEKYFYKGKRYWGENNNNVEDDVQMKSVGLTVKVTPRINEKGFVVMKIEEKIESADEVQKINENEWPIVSSRKLNADIAVQSGQTIMLGGLVQNAKTISHTKIPLLGDIPVLGRLFRSDSDVVKRTEVLVFLTPYVLDTPEALRDDAVRRKASSDMGDIWKHGWSDSDLASPPDPETARRIEAARQDLAQRETAGRLATNAVPRVAMPMQAIPDDSTTVTTNTPDAEP
ncbi:MAG: type II secretion system secretin GspD [Kiritimatiellae bacterium]|nr:type II secretion system secretin GspD [Kiritimatiellia bacterium]